MLPGNAGYPESARNTTTPRKSTTSTVIAGRVGGQPGKMPMNPAMQMSSGDGPDLTSLFEALKRRWLLAIVIGLAVAAGVAVTAWKFLTPKYTAFTQIRIASERPDLLNVNSDGRNEFNTYLRSQASIIRTRWILNKALNREEVKRLNLDQRYPDPVAWLEQHLMVDFQKDNEVVKITVSSEDASAAKACVLAVTNAYRDEQVFKENQKNREQVSELESLYNSSSDELRKTQNRLEQVNKDLGMIDDQQAELQRSDHLAQLSSARSELIRVQIQLLKLEGELQAHQTLESKLASAPILEGQITTAIENDPTLRKYEAEKERWERLLDQHRNAGTTGTRGYRLARTKFNESESDVSNRRKELRERYVKQVRSQQRNDYDGQLVALKNGVALLKAQEVAMQKNIVALAGTLKQTTKSTAEKQMLESEIQRRQSLLGTLGNRLELSRMNLRSGERIQFTEGVALEPRDNKKQMLATALGFCASFGAVCFAIAWWEFRRRRVQNVSQVSNNLGLRLLGTMPSSRNAPELVNADAISTVNDEMFIESIDAIRTLLLHQGNVNGMKILMVTSADTGEGKTLLSSHLAGSLARAGKRTLLIDADLRFPGVHGLFDLPPEPGLCDILVGEADTVDTVQPTTLDGLHVLPAGTCDRDVLQALARDGMQDVLGKLKDEFDHIIIDSHAVLGATDALLVGQHVDAAILTVLRDVSHMPHVQAASQRLTDVGIAVLGAIVNGLDAEEVYSHGGVNYQTPIAV